MVLPDIDSLASVGGPLSNYSPIVDPTTDVDAAGYFTDGYDLGIREGDLLFHYRSGTGAYFYYCNAASATTGVVDFTNATVLTATDSD